ncbi:Uncharacterised protein [Streptococcus criceti]|uniref:SMODS and SLOG-associating 2TM effector domain-containing protein n=1 Tax=Streptococcus criceti HS-6 TaxID=873449 RepID=G5JPL6_STRCG|nr:hypothetical protein [Streptococcus criceti]EHI74826.1 hypothetical protein STRCR_0369 [Streptococcus criceti HS-6]SUN41860.1 Uncharacterised protein [Streptococcus criceti]
MTPISDEIYTFTKNFLKLKRKKLSCEDKIFVATALAWLITYFISLIYLTKVLSGKTSVSDQVILGLMSILTIFFVVYDVIYIKKIKKEDVQKNLEKYLEKYCEFKHEFEEEYGKYLKNKLVSSLNHIVEDLQKDIELRIEKNKYKFDEVLQVVSLAPIVSTFFSIGKYDPIYYVFAFGTILLL